MIDPEETRRIRLVLLTLGAVALALFALLYFANPPPGEHPWRDAISTP